MSGPDADALSIKSRKVCRREFLIQIARTGHIKSGGLKGLRDQTSVVGRCREGSDLVIGIADDQGDALFGGFDTGRHHAGQEKHRKVKPTRYSRMLHDKTCDKEPTRPS